MTRKRARPSNPTIHPVYLPSLENPPPAEGNHATRRALKLSERRSAKRAAREQLQPLTVDRIPAGSLLSDETLARIRAGEYAVARYIAPRGTTAARKPARNPSAERRYQRRNPTMTNG